MPRARAVAMLAAGAFAAALGLIVLATGALSGPEHGTVDARYDLRGAQPPPADVVVVGIDDRTLGEAGFPLNRHRHARVIEQLKKAGAKVIAFDIQFTQQSRFPAADNALIEAVRAAAPRIVLATTAVDPKGKTEIFGGGAGLKYSRATPAFSVVSAS